MHHFARSCQVKVQAKQAAQIKQIRNWFSYSKLWIFFFFLTWKKSRVWMGCVFIFILKRLRGKWSGRLWGSSTWHKCLTIYLEKTLCLPVILNIPPRIKCCSFYAGVLALICPRMPWKISSCLPHISVSNYSYQSVDLAPSHVCPSTPFVLSLE